MRRCLANCSSTSALPGTSSFAAAVSSPSRQSNAYNSLRRSPSNALTMSVMALSFSPLIWT